MYDIMGQAGVVPASANSLCSLSSQENGGEGGGRRSWYFRVWTVVPVLTSAPWQPSHAGTGAHAQSWPWTQSSESGLGGTRKVGGKGRGGYRSAVVRVRVRVRLAREGHVGWGWGG